jgi:hypothetical protein
MQKSNACVVHVPPTQPLLFDVNEYAQKLADLQTQAIFLVLYFLNLYTQTCFRRPQSLQGKTSQLPSISPKIT